MLVKSSGPNAFFLHFKTTFQLHLSDDFKGVKKIQLARMDFLSSSLFSVSGVQNSIHSGTLVRLFSSAASDIKFLLQTLLIIPCFLLSAFSELCKWRNFLLEEESGSCHIQIQNQQIVVQLSCNCLFYSSFILSIYSLDLMLEKAILAKPSEISHS